LWFAKGCSTVKRGVSLAGSRVAPPSRLVKRESVERRLAGLCALGAVYET